VSRRFTPEQVRRRRDAVYDLYVNGGWGITQIQEALGLKSATTVSEDLRAVYPPGDRSGTSYRRPKRPGKPPRVDWLSDPPGDMRESVLPLVRGFLSDLQAQNYRNALAWAVAQAEAEGAASWLVSARQLASGLQAAAQAVAAILDDPAYRKDMATTAAGRDDLRRPAAVRTDETAVIAAMDMLEAGRNQKAIGRELGLEDNSMRLAAVVAVARDRLANSR
jgi:hypothetical protein